MEEEEEKILEVFLSLFSCAFFSKPFSTFFIIIYELKS